MNMMVRKRCLALHVSAVRSQLRRRSLFQRGGDIAEKLARVYISIFINFELKNYYMYKEHKLGAHMMLFALVKEKDVMIN